MRSQPEQGSTELAVASPAPIFAEQAPHAAPDQPQLDASALQDLLVREFSPAEEEAQAKPAPLKRGAKPLPPALSRILKTIAGLAILASVGWMPLQRLFQVSSVEAVVNAQIVTLRAPIGGAVLRGPNEFRVGAQVAPGNVLMTVENVRADHNGIERATKELQAAKEDLAATAARIERLTALRATIASRVEDYRADRIRRIGSSLAAADARIASAMAVLERATAEVSRQSSLAASGVGAMATRQSAERDLAVARAELGQAEAQKKMLTVEADALKAGRFFGDSYDDVPQSVQRLDQIAENLATLAADRDRLTARMAHLGTELRSEQARFDLASRATITAPAGGSVWEMLTSPGEQVVAGQPLFSLLDCSKLVVTAAVTETVYNTLSIGMPASFSFREGGRAFPGHVAQLSGVAAAGSNFAIIPSALTKESYRVTVAVDNLAGASACPVGQTGRVVFAAAS